MLVQDLVIPTRAPSPIVKGLTLIAVADELWRVVDPSGRIIGHLGAKSDDAGRRNVARRYHPGSHAFREVGQFWSAQEAIECLRLSR